MNSINNRNVVHISEWRKYVMSPMHPNQIDSDHDITNEAKNTNHIILHFSPNFTNELILSITPFYFILNIYFEKCKEVNETQNRNEDGNFQTHII